MPGGGAGDERENPGRAQGSPGITAAIARARKAASARRWPGRGAANERVWSAKRELCSASVDHGGKLEHDRRASRISSKAAACA